MESRVSGQENDPRGTRPCQSFLRSVIGEDSARCSRRADHRSDRRAAAAAKRAAVAATCHPAGGERCQLRQIMGHCGAHCARGLYAPPSPLGITPLVAELKVNHAVKFPHIPNFWRGRAPRSAPDTAGRSPPPPSSFVSERKRFSSLIFETPSVTILRHV